MLGARSLRMGRRFPIRLQLGQDPESRFTEMACNGADGDSRTTAGANAFVEANDVAVLPSFPVVVSDDHVSGLDEGELQVLIGFFA